MYEEKTIPTHELLEVFPEAKRICKSLIKTHTAEIIRRESFRAYFQDRIYKEYPTEVWERERWTEIITGCLIERKDVA